jgi:BirA family biotin operon repressor/biotin-[acetyl-CoA-carboxylase] ligase
MPVEHRGKAAGALAAGLAHWMKEWRQSGFEEIRAGWMAKAGPLGAEMDVRLGEGLVSGRYAGLDRDGGLLLDTPKGPLRIVSGELLGRTA